MKKMFKKANLWLKLSVGGVFILGLGLMVGSPNSVQAGSCPNGCLTDLGTCYYNGPHAYEEAQWPEMLQ